MAPSKLEGRNNFVWMNWFGGAWPPSKIPAKWSLTLTRAILERGSERKPSFRAITHGSARPVSKAGSLRPRRKFRVRILSPQGSQWWPTIKRVARKPADIATAGATRERGVGKHAGP